MKLKEKKPKRNGLLPSDKDFRLLGEAVTLSNKNKIYFITDDNDYIFFKNEIRQELSVDVIELLDLRAFAQQLKNLFVS